MEKKMYKAPETEVKEMEVLQVLCESPGSNMPEIGDDYSDPGLSTGSNKNVWDDLW